MHTDLLISAPEPQEIKAARLDLGLSQNQCSILAGVSGRNIWALYEKGDKKPSKQTWTIFLLASGKHPIYFLNNA